MENLKALDGRFVPCVLVRSRDQWSSTVSVVRHLLTEDNGRRLRNIVDWLKLDINTIGCQSVKRRTSYIRTSVRVVMPH